LKLQARKQADTALKPRLANDRGLHPETNNRTATGSALRSCMNANDRGLHPETKITVLNNPAHEETSTQAVKHRRP